MSTTITYNGSTITQVNNETKTLLTSGKWLTGNIILTDVSSSGGSSTLTTKNITQNGTYLASDDNADGYSSVVVNVSSGGGTPSATAHTIEFEFTDETSTTLTGYWDAAFITSAITATTPTEYGGKTVESASLDGTEWYHKSSGWETYYDGTISVSSKSFYIPALNDLFFAVGETWKVTYDGTEYVCEVVYSSDYGVNYIGNINLANGGSGPGEPFLMYNFSWTGFMGNARDNGSHTVKLEKQTV